MLPCAYDIPFSRSQMPSTVLDHEVVPIAACLTMKVRTGPMGDDLSELLRQPCRGGNATGLNRVNMSAGALDPFQQWRIPNQHGEGVGGNLVNIGAGPSRVDFVL
jgi:hypothetical protein